MSRRTRSALLDVVIIVTGTVAWYMGHGIAGAVLALFVFGWLRTGTEATSAFLRWETGNGYRWTGWLTPRPMWVVLPVTALVTIIAGPLMWLPVLADARRRPRAEGGEVHPRAGLCGRPGCLCQKDRD